MIRAVTHQLAQRVNRDAGRLPDRPHPAEIEALRGQIRRLWQLIDGEYTAEQLGVDLPAAEVPHDR